MCMHKLSVAMLVMLFVSTDSIVSAEESPGLGQEVDTKTIAALDIAVLPNGDGLPEGSGTAAAGAAVYRQHCEACHGKEGKGGINDRLAGGQGSLTSKRPVKTVGSFWPYASTIFDFVRRAMPYQAPGTLSNDELYAVTAYLLYLNGIIGEQDELDAESLPRVEMPNREGFVWAYAPELDN